MTVRDLIDILEELPMDARVQAYDTDHLEYYDITKVEMDSRYCAVIE